ncbi:hypothetical protein ACFQH3_06500 [Haladaptatus sp. GCM10025707]|uniref:hypothetical protein n=1 Tax=unclassified Haladaptatus TaxID=2622732 RepID=UPI00360AC731
MVLSRDLTILVPVDISASETPSLSILDLLGPIDVVLLGYFPVPSQAEPALIKDEYGAESTRRLADIVAGRQRVTDVLVFTHDRTATIDRIADEYDCDAVLAGGDTTAIGRILVPLRGDVNLERIVSVVADLLLASEATVTLFHAIPEDTDPSQGEFLLRGRATESPISGWKPTEYTDGCLRAATPWPKSSRSGASSTSSSWARQNPRFASASSVTCPHGLSRTSRFQRSSSGTWPDGDTDARHAEGVEGP